MRVALCFSGHARTYDITHKFWKKYLLDNKNYQVDIFMSLWDTVGPRWFGEGHSEAFNPLPREDFHSGIIDSPRIDITRLRDLWNPTILEVEEYEKFHEAFRIGILPVLNERNNRGIPAGFEHHHPLSVRSMLYKRMKANELKATYETLTNTKYDVVIQARLDVALTEEISPVVLKASDRMFFHNSRSVTKEPEICDFGSIGTSDLMDFYCNLYYQLDNELANVGGDFFQFLNPHKMYVRYFHRYDVNYEERDLNLCIVRDSGQILGWPHAAYAIRNFKE